ncbi:MAG: hypothetical protein R6U50_13475 [Desulfobacterales bacterium]
MDDDRNDMDRPADAPDENEVIDLTRVVRPEAGNSGSTMPEALFSDEEEEDGEGDTDLGRLVADVIGEGVSDADVDETESVAIPLNRLEAVIQNVIERVYSEKIEMLVMKKAEEIIQAEIEKIYGLIEKIVRESEPPAE